jgi:hypothetical protein
MNALDGARLPSWLQEIGWYALNACAMRLIIMCFGAERI